MNISKVLNSLDESWERDVILLKIKNGLDTGKIVNEFLANNKIQIKKLNTLLRPEDIDLLNQIEQLSNCESKLINKIKSFNNLENNENNHIIQENILSSNRVFSKRIGALMINWSNKFVVIALLIISAIALSKQAWA